MENLESRLSVIATETETIAGDIRAKITYLVKSIADTLKEISEQGDEVGDMEIFTACDEITKVTLKHIPDFEPEEHRSDDPVEVIGDILTRIGVSPKEKEELLKAFDPEEYED